MATALLDALKRSKQAPPDTTTKEDDDEGLKKKNRKVEESALDQGLVSASNTVASTSILASFKIPKSKDTSKSKVSRNRVSKDRNSALECSSKVADVIIEENIVESTCTDQPTLEDKREDIDIKSMQDETTSCVENSGAKIESDKTTEIIDDVKVQVKNVSIGQSSKDGAVEEDSRTTAVDVLGSASAGKSTDSRTRFGSERCEYKKSSHNPTEKVFQMSKGLVTSQKMSKLAKTDLACCGVANCKVSFMVVKFCESSAIKPNATHASLNDG